MQAHLTAGNRVVVPEIADYEVRRELLRLQRTQSIQHLDFLAMNLTYLSLTTTAMRQAAVLWATARQQGQPTAGDDTIDCDMILVAQAMTFGATQTVIATTNIGHLGRFFPADVWQNFHP
jgi:predicted nucleic acid-binding protein